VISKNNRLSEREVKKVLTRWKPFFSYWIVLNYMKNNLPINRFAIVLWWKSVKTNVDRNFFRRRFYDVVGNSSLYSSKWKDLVDNSLKDNKIWLDLVFVVKKQTKLDSKEEGSKKSFFNDIEFLLSKV